MVRYFQTKKKQGPTRANKSSFDGYEFRSGLELFCYKTLKAKNIPFLYEGKTFTVLDQFINFNTCYEFDFQDRKKPMKFKTQRIQDITYTPDFIDPNEKWVLECKGNMNEQFPLRWKLFKKRLTDENKKIDIYLAGNQKQVLEVIDIIKNKY